MIVNAILLDAPVSISTSMWRLGLPVVEKLARPAVMYVVLILFLRLFGKRELAQLNPFDLVVLLCLSNTVQNAIIGNDNSVTGGIIGAFSLLSVNWLLMRFLYFAPKVNQALEGSETVLILDGMVDHEALKQETLTETELLAVLHRQSFGSFDEVRRCVLEPNGTFYIEGRIPSADQQQAARLMEAVEKLTHEVRELRAEIKGGNR